MKKSLIVGGSSGIGLSLARQLIREGHEVAIWNRNRPEDLDGHYFFESVDVQADSPLPVLEGEWDHLVYCPGTIRLKPFKSLKDEEFLTDYKINVLGAIKIIRHMLPHFSKTTKASIVLFSTVAVQKGMSFHASIASAKGAVEGLTRSLAAELAPAVRVNCIAPSLTDTPLAASIINSESRLKASMDRHPLKRIGSPEQISSLAAYLLSDHAAFITGQVIGVDGGLGSLQVG